MSFPTQELIQLIRSLYPGRERIALHAPLLSGESNDCLAATVERIHSEGPDVLTDEFEAALARFTGAAGVVAVSSGSRALTLLLRELGIKPGTMVLTQALTYAATAHAILELQAIPVFLDVDQDTLCLSLSAVQRFVSDHCQQVDDRLQHTESGAIISACLPVHVLGRCGELRPLRQFCDDYSLALVEDAAQACGSGSGESHSGLIGHGGILSFNWNKTFTCGGGGVVLTQNPGLASRVRHQATMCRVEHSFQYRHDGPGAADRLSPFHAGLGLEQLERADQILHEKKQIHETYTEFSRKSGVPQINSLDGTSWNHWLNAITLPGVTARDDLLNDLNNAGIQARPLWDLMVDLPHLKNYIHDDLTVSRNAWERTVCLPSGLRGENG